jgi:hypothetical protein
MAPEPPRQRPQHVKFLFIVETAVVQSEVHERLFILPLFNDSVLSCHVYVGSNSTVICDERIGKGL